MSLSRYRTSGRGTSRVAKLTKRQVFNKTLQQWRHTSTSPLVHGTRTLPVALCGLAHGIRFRPD